MKGVDDMQEQREVLISLMGKLQRNKQQLSLEVLQTKYKKAYTKIVTEIENAFQLYAQDFLNARMQHSCKTEYAPTIQQIVQQVLQKNAYPKKFGHALIHECRIEAIDAILEDVWEDIQIELHEYYNQNLSIRDGNNITCMITGETWEENEFPYWYHAHA